MNDIHGPGPLNDIHIPGSLNDIDGPRSLNDIHSPGSLNDIHDLFLNMASSFRSPVHFYVNSMLFKHKTEH